MATIYQVPAARSFVVEKICGNLDNLSPAPLLGMAVKYRLPELFVPSYKRLASTVLHTLGTSELTIIPPSILSSLLAVRYQIYVMRANLSTRKPSQYHDRTVAVGCSGSDCAAIMVSGWDDVAAPKLLDSTWFSGAEILQALLDHFEQENICAKCRSQYRRDFSSVFDQEGRLIDGALEQAFNTQGFDARLFGDTIWTDQD